MSQPIPLFKRPPPRSRQVWFGLAFVSFALSASSVRGEDASVGTHALPPTGWSADLSLTQEYRFRTTGSADVSVASPLGPYLADKPPDDHDLRLTLDGWATGMGEHFLAAASAALWLDLDGHVPKGEPAFFGDPQDMAQPLFVAYTLSAEWRRSAPLDRFAVGRQQSTHGLPVTFDGAALDLRFLERRLSLFAYGGRTVHFFEAVPGLLENWLIGGGAGLRLTPNLQVEIDSRYLHETVLGLGGVQGKRVDTNSYGLAVAGRWEELSGKLFVRGINRSFSHVGGVFRLQLPRAAMGVDGQATAQLVPLGEIAESESPYYSMLGNSLPHLRARLETWKEFRLGEKAVLALAVGARVRQLLHDEPARFNRNINAFYFRADVNDLGWKGLFASITSEWSMPTQSSDPTYAFSLGGAAGYSSRTSRLEAGTYFQRFKINYYRDVEELTNARTVYAMVGYHVLPQLEVRGRYVLEILDRTIHTAYLALREDF